MTDFAAKFEEVPAHRRTSSAAGAGLALSGGGFRAMLFHVGSLRRLHEVGALREVRRISSVSGGSITAAVLARNWQRLKDSGNNIAEFEETVQKPLFRFASKKLDVKAIVGGLLLPGRSVSDIVSRMLGDFFDGASLQDLPDEPRFVFCASNMGSGSLLRFSKEYTADYRIGKRDRLDLPLGRVVAASAAFPPVLSPMVIDLNDADALTQSFGPAGGAGGPTASGHDNEDAPPLAGQRAYTHRLELADGGIYDNLGIQPIEQFHTLLVSDGGGPFGYAPKVGANWISQTVRSWKVTDNQVRARRRSELLTELTKHERNGSFWSIQTEYAKYPSRDLAVDPGWATTLQAIPTRLWTIPEVQRKQLINWSYCLADAALRSFVAPDLDPPPKLPYPECPLDVPPG